jgi:uncharacterized Zn finger protein (UPF0148 family)
MSPRLGKEDMKQMSPRLGKEVTKQNVVNDYNEAGDHRDDREQVATRDETREKPSRLIQSSPNPLKNKAAQLASAQLASKEYVETAPEQIESKTISRQEEILRKLGILYLDHKVTRARVHENETDETILRKAGISFVDTPEYKQEAEKRSKNDMRREFNDKISSKPIKERDAKILKDLGVLSLAGFSITKDVAETLENKSISVSASDSTTSTVASGSVNSSYADRKLIRRLRKGWITIGRECVCGMPVIAFKGNYECVICGVVGDETYCEEVQDIVQVESHMVGGSPGIFLLSSDTNMSTLPSAIHADQAEEVLREELGHRLFSGWVLIGRSCPACSLPLIGKNSNTSVCVRCG